MTNSPSTPVPHTRLRHRGEWGALLGRLVKSGGGRCRHWRHNASARDSGDFFIRQEALISHDGFFLRLIAHISS